MTVDVEDWFHILDNNLTAGPEHWANFPHKVEEMTSRLLDIFSRRGLRATFFVLGYVARRHPSLVQEIVSRGHEVASHSDMHQLVYRQTQSEFERDLVKSIEAIHDASGVTVTTYRAPGFSITNDCLWAFDTLASNGIKVDCSIFPAPRAHGGISEFSTPVPCKLRLRSGHELRELPMSTVSVGNHRLVYGGGGYFRLLPRTFIEFCFRTNDYNMTYFHPRDLEKDQPIAPGLSVFRKFKSTVGLAGAERKFQALIEAHKFVSVSEAVEDIDWASAKVIDLHG